MYVWSCRCVWRLNGGLIKKRKTPAAADVGVEKRFLISRFILI